MISRGSFCGCVLVYFTAASGSLWNLPSPGSRRSRVPASRASSPWSRKKKLAGNTVLLLACRVVPPHPATTLSRGLRAPHRSLRSLPIPCGIPAARGPPVLCLSRISQQYVGNPLGTSLYAALFNPYTSRVVHSHIYIYTRFLLTSLIFYCSKTQMADNLAGKAG